MSALALQQNWDTTRPDAADEIAGMLAQRRAAIEGSFLDVGSQLGRCMEILSRHSKILQAIPRDIESPELIEASNGLSGIGAQAREVAASFGTERDAMAELIKALLAAEVPIANLARTVKMIGIMAVNARVMAASIGEMEGFEDFTGDIATLSSQAGGTVREFSEAFAHLIDHVRRTESQRIQFETGHRTLLVDLASNLSWRLEELAANRRTAADAATRTNEITGRIAERVGTVVFSLQVGDSTRQRLEHVEAALDQLQALGPNDATGGHVRTLQGLQMRALAAELGQDAATGEKNLRSLVSDASEIVRQSKLMTGASGKGSESALAQLTGALRGAVDLLRSCEAERAKLDHLASGAVEVVETLLGHVASVKAIESNMRLLSLNATMRCARLGQEGRALNVIAQQLRELTAETVSAAEETLGGLSRVSELAAHVAKAAHASGAGEVGRIEEQVRLALNLLDAVEERLKAAGSVLSVENKQVSNLLVSAATAFSGQIGIAGEITRAANGLESEGSSAQGQPLGAAGESIMAALRMRYTMQSERVVHDRFIGTLASA